MFGAGKGVRTLDIDLGKVVLYQLSYTRMWSGQRESNSRANLGKVPGYHYIMTANPNC